jgi:DNA-binding MarR family transcriptional regulator
MPAPSASDIAAVRRFNRFFTRELGLLRRTFLDSDYTLGEMRVLFEIRQRPGLTASDIARDLDLDAAYLSRLISRFERQKLISRKASVEDGRHYHLTLTATGLAAVNETDVRQATQTRTQLARLSVAERQDLIAAMGTIETLLSRERP